MTAEPSDDRADRDATPASAPTESPAHRASGSTGARTPTARTPVRPTRRPRVTWVVDGRDTAGRTGTGGTATSSTTTSTPGRDLAEIRSEADTLLMSTAVALAHEARGATHSPDGRPTQRQQLRVLMGTQPVDTDLPLFDGPVSTLHFATCDPGLALAAVYDLGGRHVLLEGEPALAAEFVRAGLVDETVDPGGAEG